MIYSPTAQYALRAALHLARRYGEGPTLGRSIAEAEEIPPSFLPKILHSLRACGLVKTRKGRGGGYQLAISPDRIRIRQVVECIDGTIDFETICVLGLPECSGVDSCALHDHWKRIRRDFEKNIDRQTLAEVANGFRD
ncbi:MAG: Rrf2 family transcriptional regulator [Gemmatimonadetes bacterium]|nr:Rrf2 family transcriptional regulator [Gemmatimonadota bacterium]